MVRRPGLSFCELRLTRRGETVEIRVALPPEQPHDLPLARLVRDLLDGTGALLEEGGFTRAVLEVETGGERFRVVRGESARFVRVAPEGEHVLAEGDERVTGFIARLAGSTEPLGRRAVARAGDVAAWLRRELEGAGGMHEAVHSELQGAATALGARMRELLLRAQDLLREATEEISPQRGEPLTPEDLGALREEIVVALAGVASRLAAVEESTSLAEDLVAKMRRRQERISEYLRAEQLGRKLEKQKNLMAAQRRRLERARAAEGLSRPEHPAASTTAERQARIRAEEALAAARAELSAARAGLAAEEAKAPERDAAGAWIERLSGMTESLALLQAARVELEDAESRAAELETWERDAKAEAARCAAELQRVDEALAAVEASPEDAARAREEAARAARLSADVRRLAQVRDELRDGAREVQLAKIGAERAQEELELARREVEWAASSPHPRDSSELPSIPALFAHAEALRRRVDEASAALAATREDLRRRTSELGTRAYLSPDLLEAEAREKAALASRFGVAGFDRASIEGEEAALRARLAQAATTIRHASEEIGRISLQRLSARETIARAEQEIPEHLRGPGALQSALSQSRRDHAARLQAWDEARRACLDAESRVKLSEDAWRRARDAEEAASRRILDVGADLAPLRQAGFESWDEVAEARLPGDELRELESEVAEHEALERLVEEGQRAGRDDLLMPRTDPNQLELMHSLLLHARDVGRSRHERSAGDLAAIDRRLDALDEIAAELDHVESAAGLGSGDGPGGAFEDRAREGLARAVLARAEGRLARWRRPWTLAWEGAPGAPRRLVAFDAETGEPVPRAEMAAAGELALALAVELALAGEPVDLACLFVEGASSLPHGETDVMLVLG